MDDPKQARTALFLHAIDVATGTGLEIGPLANPVVGRDKGDIRYVDHAGTADLRARYSVHRDVDVARIVDVDYSLDGRTLRDTVGESTTFDYVIASHVLEHVPDLVGWLADVRSVLREGGILALAIPDMRRGFDIARDPTRIHEVIDAHVRRAMIPSPQQIFDHLASAVTYLGDIVWAIDPTLDELVPMYSERDALETATASHASGDYVDVHCWVFTPDSFRIVVSALERLGLSPFTVERSTDTLYGEFFVTLRADDGEPRQLADCRSPLDSSNVALTRQLARATADLAHAQLERDQFHEQLDRTHATLSWRITQPLRLLHRLLRR